MAQLWSIRNSRFSFSLENKDTCSAFSQFNHSNTKEDNTKISVRNQINDTVVAVKDGAVNGHVAIKDESGIRISGSITNEAIEQLGLKEGGKAAAIIKSTNVMVAVG